MKYDFEQLIAACDKEGEPFQLVTRKNDGSFQVSIRSKYSTGAHNAFSCDNGKTATEALVNIMRNRKIKLPPPISVTEEEDPLS